jgi:general secretion pathway protein F
MSETVQAGSGGGHGPITLDQLIALNDEIVALTRAGMPLEQGLIVTGRDLPGRLRQVATSLGERMSRGESLPQALDSLGAGVPRVYKAVVQAGARSGNLSTALEGLSTFARGYADARRSIGLALWYPLIVLSLAYALFLFIITVVIPRFFEAFVSMGLPVHWVLRTLEGLNGTVWYWGPILPIVLAGFCLLWVGSRRALSLDGGRGFDVLRWFPWMGKLVSGFEAASFADLLALLIEQRVPYPEALRLAGEASGDAALARSSEDLASAVERGLSPDVALEGRSAFPPLLRWLLATGPRQGDLVAALKQMSDRYRNEARYQADKIRVLLPSFLLFGIGATSTLLYALAVFLPMSSLWTSIAGQTR